MSREPALRLPRHLARCWAWVLALAFVLQAAAPLLATGAASSRGISLAEVCSVYGQRLVVADDSRDQEGSPLSRQHDAGSPHCPLASLLTGLALPPTWPVVAEPARVQARQRLVVVGRTLPIDASRRWLARRLHAPPVSV